MTVGIASRRTPGAKQVYDFTGTEIDLDAIRKRIASCPMTSC